MADVVILHFKVGLCIAAAVQILYKLGLSRAMVVFILVIGLWEHRTYMLALMDASVEIFGMVAEEVLEVDWTPSQPHGKVGEASAGQKLTYLNFQARRALCSLGIGSIYVGRSCETFQAWLAGGGT